MKIFKIAILLIIILSVAGLIVSAQETKDRDELYQVSVLNGLMKGDYDGKVTLDEIRKHGDFGFGTFDRLDGEAIELDGVFYQVRSDGTVRRPAGTERSPFAMATFFDTDMEFSVTQVADYSSLRKLIDSRLPTRNIPYAIRIDGKFTYVKARSVPAQNKPYPSLAEVVKNQSVFEFRDIEGTLVGFVMPEYMQGVNIPGYHVHFLSRDKTKGGHLLECVIASGKVKIDNIDRFTMALPGSADFDRLDFSSNVSSAPVETSPQALTQDDVDRLNAMEREWGANIDKAVPFIRQKNYPAASAYLKNAASVISGINDFIIKKGYKPGVLDRLTAMDLLTGAYVDMARIAAYAGSPKTIGNNIQAIRALFDDARQKLSEAKVKFHEVPQLQELCVQFLGTLDDFEVEVKKLFSFHPLSKPKT